MASFPTVDSLFYGCQCFVMVFIIIFLFYSRDFCFGSKETKTNKNTGFSNIPAIHSILLSLYVALYELSDMYDGQTEILFLLLTTFLTYFFRVTVDFVLRLT